MSTTGKWARYLPGIDIHAIPKHTSDVVKLFGISDDSQSLPAKHLTNAVLFGCSPAKTVIVERDYIDRGHSIAFSRVYARSFKFFARNCLRMHFFSSPVSAQELVLGSAELLQQSYMGFCVLRDAPERRTIGRMIMRLGNVPEEAGSAHQGFFPVDLVGHRLKAFGVPFLQRDRRVAACATSALWMSLSLARESLHSSQDFSLADISESALGLRLGIDGQPVRTLGLTTKEMERAINHLGLNCAVYQPRYLGRVSDLLCKHLDSGIAPILHLRLGGGAWHATVVTGYAGVPMQDAQGLTEQGFLSSSGGVAKFYMHDDRLGAYRPIELDCAAGIGSRVKIDWLTQGLTEDETTHESALYGNAIVRAITVPLPPRVYLRAEEAETKAWWTIQKLCETSVLATSTAVPVLRTYLASSNDFKERLNPALDGRLRSLYRGTHMPRYVWVTEHRLFERDKKPDEMELHGTVLTDPTAEPRGKDFVAVHVATSFCRMTPSENDPAMALSKSTDVRSPAPMKAPLLLPA